MPQILSYGLPTVNAIDLSKEIVVTNPVTTPLTSLLLSKGKAKEAKDRTVRAKQKTLSSTPSGARLEGAEAPAFEKSSFGYVDNVLEIFSKATNVSGTTGAIQGSTKSALANEIQDRLLEMKGNIETAFFTGVKNVGGDTVARQTEGLLNQIHADNVIDKLAGALTEDDILDALQKMYTKGATAGELFLFSNATIKRKINKLFGDSARSTIQLVPGANGAGILIDKIYSDFGEVNLVMANDVPAGQLMVANLDYIEVPTLRSAYFEALAKTGDSEKGQVVAELGILLQNQFAGAKIINIA